MHVILCLFWIGFATWGIHEITGIESEAICFFGMSILMVYPLCNRNHR